MMLGAEPLTIEELFDAQLAQVPYQRLVDVINAQVAHISRLETRFSALEYTHRKAVTAQQVAMEQLTATVAHLESIQEQHQVAKRTLSAQNKDVELLKRHVRDLSSSISDLVQHMDAKLTSCINDMSNNMASIELVTTLQTDQHILHQQLASIEARVECKVDKSELSRLECVVAKIHSFAFMATTLASRIDNVEVSQSQHGEALQRNQQQATLINQQVDELFESLTTKVETQKWQETTDKFMAQVESLQKEWTEAQQVLSQLVTRGVSLESNHRAHVAKLESATSRISEDMKQLQQELMSAVNEKMARQDADNRLLEIRHELDCKAWKKDTSAVASTVFQLLEQCNVMEKQVQLSTRFLEWFAQRGEAYERNLDVVERQLQRMTHGSLPANRQPFSSQVRYENPL